MLPTDLTVSAVVEQDGRYLVVEERASGVVVLTPGQRRPDSFPITMLPVQKNVDAVLANAWLV